MDAKKFVFKVKDVPLWETADGEMRDQFMITDKVCGANNLTGGLYWMRPKYRGPSERRRCAASDRRRVEVT